MRAGSKAQAEVDVEPYRGARALISQVWGAWEGGIKWGVPRLSLPSSGSICRLNRRVGFGE